MIDINGTYCIGNNAYNIILFKKSVALTGKNAGETVYVAAGYYTTYEALYKGMMRIEQIKSVELANVKEIVESLKKISDDTLKAICLHKCESVK